MDIGSRIRSARKVAGLTQEELARRADMSLKGMGDIERGAIPDPHYSSLSKIAAALGVSVGELLEEPALPLGEGPLSVEWAYRADYEVFQRRIREATSGELRKLGADLLKDFYRVRTREELVEEGPDPDARRARAFSFAGFISEELVQRSEKPLEQYVLALKKFTNAIASEAEEAEVRAEEDQGRQAG